MRTHLEAKKSQGICLDCQERASGDSRWCLKHLELRRLATRRARLKKKIQGRCVQCSELAISGGRCRVHAEAHRQEYWRAKAAGRCYSCGDLLQEGGCSRCAAVAQKRREVTKACGRCVNHPDRPTEPGLTICIRCRWSMWDSVLRTKYGITPEEYAWMEYRQSRRCKACGDQPFDGLNLDHHHGTGAIRGLLCGPCNRLIGHAKEQVSRLQACIAYLQNHRQET